MRIVLTSLAFAGLVIMPACHRQEAVPAEVQFVRDEATRFTHYTELVNRTKEDVAATASFIAEWDGICKKRNPDQVAIALGTSVGCGTKPAAPAPPAQGEKK